MWAGILVGVGFAGYVPATQAQTVRNSTPETRWAVVELFVRGNGDQSRAGREYLQRHYADRPGITIKIRDVLSSKEDLARMWQLARHFRIDKPLLPAFYVSGRLQCGWNEESVGEFLDESLTIEAFVRRGCPHCAAARPFLQNILAPRYPGYRLVERDIGQSYEAQARLQMLARRYGVAATSVPAIHLCGRLLVGFQSEQSTGRQWDELLHSVTIPAEPRSSFFPPRRGFDVETDSWRLAWTTSWALRPWSLAGMATFQADTDGVTPPPPAEQPPESSGALTADSELPPLAPDDAATLPALPETATASDVVELPWLGQVHWRQWGLPAFTLAVGLIDGFNPCAMWVLLFLLSLLVNIRHRWTILAVAGTFVFVSGAAYYAFMAAWLNVFQLIGLLRPAQIALGLLGIVIGAIHIKDFFAFKKGVSLSIPETAKPSLYARMRTILAAETLWAAVLGAAVLAVLVNIIELLCTAGLPAMYTSLLTLQQLPAWENYAYLLLYIAAYMLDDSLMVAVAVVTLGHHKLQERGGRVLKLASGLVILLLGGVMLIRPEWLG